MTLQKVSLLIVDDHPVVRLGLVDLFRTVPDITVVGQAASAAEAISEARRCRPDAVIMDVRLPDGNGIEACREIRSENPNTHVLMLTSYTDEGAVVASIMAGASGYLLKQIDPQHLLEAVVTVARGGSLLDPGVTQVVLDRLRRLGSDSAGNSRQGLSEQEERILAMIAEGKTNREIAAAIYLSEHTVKSYVSDILQKLHLSRRAEAAAFFARRSIHTES